MRTLYMPFDLAEIELKTLLAQDPAAPIEVPPEQYEAITAKFPHPIICPGQFSYAQAAILAEQHLIANIRMKSKGRIDCNCSISHSIHDALAVWGIRPPLDTGRLKLCIQKKSKVGSKDDIVRMAGPKAATILFNALRVGPRVILRSAFELVRANTITRVLSALVLLSIDTVSLIKKRISKKQFVINVVLALLMTVGGTFGWVLGTETIGAVLIENAVLAIAAGIIGAGVFGAGLGMLWERLIGAFIKDDAKDMLEILNETFLALAEDYLLSQQEAEYLAEAIKIKNSAVKVLYANPDKQAYAKYMLEPYFAGIVHLRAKVG